MFPAVLRILGGLAVLLALTAAPAAQAQVCKVHLQFTCTGNGKGTLSVSCKPGETAGACCERHERDVRQLCNRVGSGLASRRCNYLGTADGTCAGSGGTSASEAPSQHDPSQLGPRAPAALKRACPRISYTYRCKTGDRGAGRDNCKRGEDTSSCCRRALARRCRHAGFVDGKNSACKCLGPQMLKRRR